MEFNEERGIAACGLACVLCSVKDCPGCKECDARHTCEIFQCAAGRGYDSCCRCPAFPCEKERYGGTRSIAFLDYAGKHGMDRLIERLRANFDAGIAYHRPGESRGQYDDLETPEQVQMLLEYGWGMHPYRQCGELETEHFTLRLVRREDARDLLTCYSDPLARPLFNSDNCTSSFFYDAVEELEAAIDFWLENYRQGAFVRYSIVDKDTGKAVGTVEIFGEEESKREWGVFRIDIASRYEHQDYLRELLLLPKRHFFHLFPAQRFVTKIVPSGNARRAVADQCGYREHRINGREHYWVVSLQQ